MYKRQQSEQSTKLRLMEGYMGHATYDRVPNSFRTLLLAAEVLHAGSDTTYGLGRLQVSFTSCRNATSLDQ